MIRKIFIYIHILGFLILGFKSLNAQEKLVKEAYNLGARALYPYHMGESLILKNFCEYIRIAKGVGYSTIMLTTTGGLIKQYNPDTSR